MANLKLDYQNNMEKDCRDRKSKTMDGQKGKVKERSQRQTNGGSASGQRCATGREEDRRCEVRSAM